MHLVGLDLGTSTICGTVIELGSGRAVCTESRPNDTWLSMPRPWQRCQDADAIVSIAFELLDSFLSRYPSVLAIGFSGQMHGIVHVDADGNALGPLHTWQDGSGDQPCEDGPTYARFLSRQTGHDLASGYGCLTHAILQVQKTLPPATQTFASIMDHAVMKLTDRKRPLVTPGVAASFGLFDLQQEAFDRHAWEKGKLDFSFAPDLAPRTAIAGHYGNIPVACAIGDHQASFLGSVKMPEISLHANVGTGSQISLFSEDRVPVAGFEIRPAASKGWLHTRSFLCGGKAYALLERFFKEYVKAAGGPCDSQYEVMERLAAQASQDGPPLAVDTAFCGSRENPEKRGSITGIGSDNFTPSQLIRGVLFGIADEMHRGLGGLKHHPQRLIGSGNAVRKSKALQESLRQRFSLPLLLCEQKEEAAFGAALHAGLASGHLANEEALRRLIRLVPADARSPNFAND